MKRTQRFSYLEFLNEVKLSKEIHGFDSAEISRSYNHKPAFSSFYPDAVFMTDYVNCKFIFLAVNNNNFLGYSHSYLQKGGPLLLCSLHQPDDFKIYNETVFPLNINYVKSREIGDLKKVIFTVNYRLKHKNGDYCAVRQRSSFVCVASDGTPLVEMSEIMDISEYKTDSKIIHTIENYNNRNYTKLLIKNHFSPHAKPVTLSSRELDVLKCVCNGLCSKQIADQLDISVNTINNHRKNMLRKTHCSNFTELGYQAKSQGLL